MTFRLENIVPWGRLHDEYCRMFSLSEENLNQPILSLGDGPASFNAVQTAVGRRVVSVDPLYQFSPKEIRQRILEIADNVLSQTEKNKHRFVWDYVKDIDDLRRIRFAAMEQFLDDFSKSDAQLRYISQTAESFDTDEHFSLALSSHFLLLYDEHLNLDFHQRVIDRVLLCADEFRIFPILGLSGNESVHLRPLLSAYPNSELHPVEYEFQRGGNQMLVIRK